MTTSACRLNDVAWVNDSCIARTDDNAIWRPVELHTIFDRPTNIHPYMHIVFIAWNKPCVRRRKPIKVYVVALFVVPKTMLQD